MKNTAELTPDPNSPSSNIGPFASKYSQTITPRGFARFTEVSVSPRVAGHVDG
jgi:hypothetical protein